MIFELRIPGSLPDTFHCSKYYHKPDIQLPEAIYVTNQASEDSHPAE